MVVVGERMRGAQLKGIEPDREAAVTPLAATIAVKQFSTLKHDSTAIVLGEVLAAELGVKVGEVVALATRRSDGEKPSEYFQFFRVAGTFKTGHFSFDSTYLYTSLAAAGKVLGRNGLAGWGVRLTDAALAPKVGSEILKVSNEPLRIIEWSRVNEQWHESLGIQKRMIAIIVSLIIAVAAFNLVSTLVISVEDRRSDISILRTIGASPSSIMAIFVISGMFTGVVGTLAGLILGLGISANLTPLVELMEHSLSMTLVRSDVYLINKMPSDPHWHEIAAIGLMSMLLSLVATLYPSWKASRANPVEGLRYD